MNIEKSFEKKRQGQHSRKHRNNGIPRWDKLDNTAHLFPVIAGESMTNTYRISVELTEDVDGAKLQEALNIVLPKFDLFNVRMRTGFFWYYFEENGDGTCTLVITNPTQFWSVSNFLIIQL